MNFDSLEMVFEDQLRDIYSAESQVMKNMPKMVKVTSSDSLRNLLEEHRSQTGEQIKRIETIAQELGIKLAGKKCKGMEGLLEEEKEVLEADGDEACIDIALVAAAQRIEHYEISAYGTACTLARQLGYEEAAGLLEETLKEEQETDKKLTRLTEEELLQTAGEMQGASEEEELEMDEEEEVEMDEEEETEDWEAGNEEEENKQPRHRR